MTLAFDLDRERIEVPIGTIETASGILGRVDLDEADASGSLVKAGADWSLEVSNGNYLEDLHLDAKGKIEDLRILIGDRSVFVGQVAKRGKSDASRSGERFEFEPAKCVFVYLRAEEGQFVDLYSLDSLTGPLELVVEDEAGGQVRHPMYLDYKVVPGDDSPFEKPYPHPITAELI